jgi:hypothetical protein
MAAIMYDAQVERFEPLLVEGRLYYMHMMIVKPIMSNQYYKLGRSRLMCCFTSKTLVHEITIINGKFIPSFPPFMPLDQFFQFNINNDMYVGKCPILFIPSVNVMLYFNNAPTNYLYYL